TPHERPGGRIDQEMVGVLIESASPGVKRLRAVTETKDKEAGPLKSQIQIDAGRLQASLSKVLVDGADLDAETDLERIGAADSRRAGAAGRNQSLIQKIGKVRSLALEAGSVDICQVIAHHVEHFLMGPESGNAGIKGSVGHDEAPRTSRCLLQCLNRWPRQ